MACETLTAWHRGQPYQNQIPKSVGCWLAYQRTHLTPSLPGDVGETPVRADWYENNDGGYAGTHLAGFDCTADEG